MNERSYFREYSLSIDSQQEIGKVLALIVGQSTVPGGLLPGQRQRPE